VITRYISRSSKPSPLPVEAGDHLPNWPASSCVPTSVYSSTARAMSTATASDDGVWGPHPQDRARPARPSPVNVATCAPAWHVWSSYGGAVPPNTRVQIRFSGGEHNGLIVEAPLELADRLPGMRFTVLASGQLFDLAEQRRMREVRLISRPGAQPEISRPISPTATSPEADVDVKPELPEPPDVAPPVPPSRPPLATPGLPLFRTARAIG
jgi:hypothetical protein